MNAPADAIPKRPEHWESVYLSVGFPATVHDCMAHEHAVAKRAMKALRDIQLQCGVSVLYYIADEAMSEIQESGWTPT